MKKNIILVLLMLFFVLSVFADDTKFAHALQNCSSYSESGTINTEGMNVVSQKQILGWQDGKCTYKENLQLLGTNACVICKFTKSQIQELASVMEAYNLVQRYTKEQVDTSSINSVQNNPVVQAWNKYLQDTSVCTVNIGQ